jgi:hypothetical protein
MRPGEEKEKMREDVMNRLPRAPGSKTMNGREKAQKAQEQKFLFATLANFRGHSICLRDEGFQSDRMTHVRLRFGAGQKGTNMNNAVKLSQTESNRFLTVKISGDFMQTP